jgi:hypothetical protein
MLKISICFIIAAIFFVISICSEVVLINKFESIIAIIVPFILGIVSTFFIVLGCYNYDKYAMNNIKNTINVSYPNAEIISNINNYYNEGYFIYDGKTYHFECDNGVLQVNEVSSMKAIPITK